MSRKYFDEFFTVDSQENLEALKQKLSTIKYDGYSGVRKSNNGRFICGVHVGNNKRLATSSLTQEMAELAYKVIQDGVK